MSYRNLPIPRKTFKRLGWKYWVHFQVIHPGTSAKGKNAFAASHTVPDLTLDDEDVPSDDDGIAASPFLFPIAHQWTSIPSPLTPAANIVSLLLLLMMLQSHLH